MKKSKFIASRFLNVVAGIKSSIDVDDIHHDLGIYNSYFIYGGPSVAAWMPLMSRMKGLEEEIRRLKKI